MESNKKRLSQKRLKELMDYDPETGIFVRKIAAGPASAGSVAGSRINGYRECQIDGKRYYCHRLAWFYVYGFLPEHWIDHVNRNRSDNRIENLREVSQQCNLRNSKQTANTASGVKGVGFDKRRATWCARIKVNFKQHNLGAYKDKDEAVCARLAAEQCLDWSGCDTDSPAYQYVQKRLKTQRKI